MTEQTRTVELPTHVYGAVEQRLDRTDFDSVDAYVAYVVEEVLAEVEESTTGTHQGIDEDEIESRLQSLGYLDR